MEDVYTATLLHYFNCQLDQILQDTRKNLGTIYLNFINFYSSGFEQNTVSFKSKIK